MKRAFSFLSPALAAVALAGCSGPSVGSTDLTSLNDAYVQVVKSVDTSVVEIRTSSGVGSGVVFDSNGDIITNAHVLGNARSFQVIATDGKSYAATLVGAVTGEDLAVIRMAAHTLAVATFADSSKVSVGEIVLAIGSPLGLQASVTQGIVSATARTVPESETVTLPDAIQTSAAINPGNSGGALVDLKGHVVGIPTLAALSPNSTTAQAPGIGFAIASNHAVAVADQLIKTGR